MPGNKVAHRPRRIYITIIAITTAATITSMFSAMPMAVIMESMENTRATATSCTTTQKKNCVVVAAIFVVRLNLAVDFVRGFGHQE